MVHHALQILKESDASDEVSVQLKKLFGLIDEESAEYMKMG